MEISWGWSPLAFGAVLVGIVRRAVADRYIQLFTEAGIGVSGFTFSAAAVHAAIQRTAGRGLSRRTVSLPSAVQARVASRFMARPAHARSSPASSNCRLSAPPRWPWPNCGCRRKPRRWSWSAFFPSPSSTRWRTSCAQRAAVATALAGACPRLARSANVLPAEYRKLNSRAVFIPTVVLAALLILAAGLGDLRADQRAALSGPGSTRRSRAASRKPSVRPPPSARSPRPGAQRAAGPVPPPDAERSGFAQGADAVAGASRLDQLH